MNLRDAWARHSSHIVALGEQALQSLYSFVVMVTAGRLLEAGEFGIFALVWTSYPVLLLLLSAAYSRPLSIVFPGAPASVQDAHRHANRWLCRLMAWLAVVASAALVAAYLADIGRTPLAILAVVAVCTIRAQIELDRRLSIVGGRERRALLRSCACLLPAGVLFVTSMLTTGTGDSAIGAVLLALASLAPAMLLLSWWRRRESTETGQGERSAAGRPLAGLWPYARDLLVAAVIEAGSRRTAPYVLAIVHGAREAGAWAAALSLVGPAQVLLMGLMNSGTPRARLAFVEGGERALRASLLRLAAILTVAYGLPLLLLGALAPLAIELVYGREIVGATTTLRVYVVAFAIMPACSLCSAYLTAKGRTRQQVYVSIGSAAVFLAGMPFALPLLGAAGIPALTIVSQLTSLLVYGYYMRSDRAVPAR